MKTHLTSVHHPLVKHIVKLRQDSDYRYEHTSLVLDGIKPVQELNSGYIRKLIYTDSWVGKIPFKVKEEWIVSEAMMKKMSGMNSPEGILAEIEMPPFSSLNGLNFILALDGISDPGNLGTLLRTALAFGWEGVFILPNSCDPYNDKALRAARGAHFRLKLAMGNAEDLQQMVKDNGWEPLVAALQGQTPHALGPAKKRLLVLGNEAHGASEAVQKFCAKVTIPMPGEMESLNVAIAGGILMYVLKHSS